VSRTNLLHFENILVFALQYLLIINFCCGVRRGKFVGNPIFLSIKWSIYGSLMPGKMIFIAGIQVQLFEKSLKAFVFNPKL